MHQDRSKPRPVSDECAAGFHTRCRRPNNCRCPKCEHLIATTGIDAAQVYSRWARAHNVKPLHLNLEKADSQVLDRAASAIEKAAPKIAQMLRAESAAKRRNRAFTPAAV